MESKKRGRDEQDDSSEKRQRRPAHPEQRILMEADKVSLVIGKGGAVIKNIVKQSSAFLKFNRPKEGTTKQVGTVSGSPDSIIAAIELLIYHLSKYPSADGKAALSLVLLVPSPQVGVIIGKGGQIVRSVQSNSGAKIQISARPETSSDDTPVDQEVTIQGNPQAISAAARILVGYLFRLPNPTGGYSGPSSAYPMSPSAYPVSSSYSSAYSSLASAYPPTTHWPQTVPQSLPLQADELEVRFALKPAEVSKIIGKGGQGIQNLCKQAHVKLVFDKQVQQSVGGAALGPAQIGTIRGDASNIANSLDLLVGILAGTETSESKGRAQIRFLLLVPSPVIGFLLGTKGAKIKETKEKSSAQINITGRADAIWDHVTGVALQAVLLEGDGEQVTIALKALVQQLEEARQTPRRRKGREEETQLEVA